MTPLVRNRRTVTVLETGAGFRLGVSMAKSFSLLSILVPAVVGVTCAFITVLLFEKLRAESKPLRPAKAEAAIGTSSELQYRTIVVQGNSAELAAIRQEVAALRSERTAAPSSPPAQTQQEALQELEQAYAEFDRKYSQERPDPTWSVVASRKLSAGLVKMGDQVGFTVRSAECKATQCRATVEWKDYQAATKAGEELTHRGLPGLNCTQSLWLNEPTNRAAAYTANLYLDCSDLRNGSVEPVAEDEG